MQLSQTPLPQTPTHERVSDCAEENMNTRQYHETITHATTILTVNILRSVEEKTKLGAKLHSAISNLTSSEAAADQSALSSGI
jgi:hypothetical protein